MYVHVISVCLSIDIIWVINNSPAFAGSSGIRAGWGIEINGIFEAEKPPASAGPQSGW